MINLRRHAAASLGWLVLLAMLSGAPSASAATTLPAPSASAAPTSPDYVPDEVVVGYAPGPFPSVAGDVVNRSGARAAAASAPAPQTLVLKLPAGVSVSTAVKALRGKPGVTYAAPNFLAHADAVPWIPNDRGRTHSRAGWQKLQWDFLAGSGVDAPQAWANLIADHRPGGRGTTVAILDTGIAYRKWHGFKASPDFGRTRFVAPYDFVSGNRYPLDREGHGTFVAGIVAESTNNRIGLTGLAYGASIMPVRVLNRDGTGDAATIARGVRYAVNHHAQVINLSLEFTPNVSSGDITVLLSALRYAAQRNVTVVGAAGNDYATQVAYPARAPSVISVGATTRDRCLAQYSNVGSRLDLVAPGGGSDKSLPSDPNCHAGGRLPPIYQMTFFNGRHPDRFGFPGGIYGTSMSAPQVAAAAALVIASGVIGSHPTPGEILSRLEQTAQPLGVGRPNQVYGWGLLDAGAATTTAPPTSSAATARRR